MLELIHHGKILRDSTTLHDNGVKSGEMVHVVKKKEQNPPAPPPTFSDAALQQLNSSMRTLGCTPNAPGWTRAMQVSVYMLFFILIIKHVLYIVHY